jgi:hypothetical protein
VPDTPLTQAPVAELLAHWRDAREWLIDARLALGHHRELLGQIRALVVADPLSEHPYVQLMLALYRSGQKVAALDVYSRLRELTSREFGQDPGPEARQTLQQILEESPTLAARPQVSPAVSLTARPPWTPVCNVPTAVPDFTGRVAVIEALARRMSAESMSVTVLTGPPGIGTTALAIQAAHLAAAEFPDGQLFIDLGSRLRRKDPAEVLSELLGALGVSAGSLPGAPSERAALYRSILANRRVLVLADDAAAAAEVRPLLPGTRGSAVLVTSHSRLADLEGAHSLDVGPMTRAEAIAMLAKVVGREGSNADDAMFADIAVACAGLPLALRVAGARLAADSSLSPADLAAALTTPGNLLSELVIGDLSVASRLAAAWRVLDPDAQHALWLLAHARRASSPPWLVRAITGAPGALRALSDSSLIRQDPVNGQYSLAPLVGSFALSQATPWLDADWPDSFGRVTAALTVS